MLKEIIVNGNKIVSDKNLSILQTMLENNMSLTKHVGCMGQGVCGSCKVLIKRKDERTVSTALACETVIEDGLQVSFIENPSMSKHHLYSEDDFKDSWNLLEKIDDIFPEAKNCRHCGGCDVACPKDLKVQEGVNLAAQGNFEAAKNFDECIFCDLCSLACPEYITPNHLGMFLRRFKASSSLRPADLMSKLHSHSTVELKDEH